MGTVPGPIISFRVSGPELAGSIQPALQDLRQQARTVSTQIADDWKRMAAQIRASVAQGISGDKEVLATRSQLVSILDKELSGLRTRNELTTKELSNLKAMTLERERQADAIKRGVGVGVTAGTSSALGQVSQQTVLGIGRVLDSLVNRYFGGAAGAAFRTARDVQYYSAQAGGGTGTGGGILGGLGAVTSAIPDGVLAVGGLTAALAGLAAVGITVTKGLADTAQAINNTAAATGLSTTQVQIYDRLAKEMDLDSGSLTNAFARLQAQIGEFVTKGKTADESTQNFIRVLDKFGISVKNTDGSVRGINDIISDFANVVQSLPDKNLAAALTMEAFGTRGKILAQIINQATVEGKTYRETVDGIAKSGIPIPEGTVQNLQKAKNAWDKLWQAVAGEAVGYRVEVAQTFLKMTGIQNVLNGEAGPDDARTKALAELRKNQSPLTGGESFFVGNPAQARAQIEALLGGEKNSYEIEQARKKAVEELDHGNYNVALSLAEQYASLKDIVKQEEFRKKEIKEINKELLHMKGATLEPGIARTAEQDVMSRLLNPGAYDPLTGKLAPPNIGNLSHPFTHFNPLAGVLGADTSEGAIQINTLQAALEGAQKSLAHLRSAHGDVDELNEEYQRDLQNFKIELDGKRISQDQYNQSVLLDQQILNNKLADIREKDLKKFEDQAGGLFEDLISGKTKSFNEALLKDIENIALAPVKKIFDQLVGSVFQSLNDLFSGKPSAGGGTGGGGLGRIWGKIGGVIGPGGTPGWWPGAIGGGAGGGVGQTGVSTQVMNVTAQVVNIATLGQAGGGAGGGFGNFFGATGLLGGFGNFFGNLNPFGGSGSSGGSTGGSVSLLTKVLGQASPFAAGAAALGLGLATGNESTIAIGAATLAGKAATALSGISALPAGLSSALGTFGQVAPGLGILASGIINADQSRTTAGKLGGTIEAGAGGALTGLILGGPIGAAIGGAIGLIGGGLASIFGGGPQGFQQSVQYAMAHNQYHAPLSENFSFASNGSIASTLGTGFQQNGSSFSQYALPSNTSFAASALTGDLTWQQLYQLQNSGLNPNAPFLGNPSTNPYVGQGPVGVHATSSPNVNVTVAIPGLVDANQIASTLAPHITSLAQMVSKQVTNSSSGFASSVRRAAFPP
jgi:hypothetical protein